jgi:hypothetical protein
MAPTASPNPRRITRSQSRDVDNVLPSKSAMGTGVSFGRNCKKLDPRCLSYPTTLAFGIHEVWLPLLEG